MAYDLLNRPAENDYARCMPSALAGYLSPKGHKGYHVAAHDTYPGHHDNSATSVWGSIGWPSRSNRLALQECHDHWTACITAFAGFRSQLAQIAAGTTDLTAALKQARNRDAGVEISHRRTRFSPRTRTDPQQTADKSRGSFQILHVPMP